MHWNIFLKSASIPRSVFANLRSISIFPSPSSSKDNFDRALEPNPADEKQKRLDGFQSPVDARIAKTVIIGCPNAGKSVLTNALIDAPVSAVSSRVHTTRKTTRGACLLNDRTQLLVMDTPGVVTSTGAKKHHLENSLLTDPEGAMLGADTVCVLLDASDKSTRDRLDPRILHLLYRHRHRLTSALVVTKVDAVKDKTAILNLAMKLTKGMVGGAPLPAREVRSTMINDNVKVEDKKSSADSEVEPGRNMDCQSSAPNMDVAGGGHDDCHSEPEEVRGVTDSSAVDETLRKHWTGVNWELLNRIATVPWPQVQELTLRKCYRNEVGWPLFDRLFMVSALNGHGIDELREYLNERARIGRWRFPPSVVTDQDPEEMVKDIVRAKLMDRLKFHIPYTLDFRVCVWEVNENDVLCIRLDVLCRQERDAKFIIGPKGQTVSEAAQEITQVLRNLFQREVFFRLGVFTSKKRK